MKKEILSAIVIMAMTAGAYICIIKFADRIEQKQPEPKPQSSIVRVDSILNDYYGGEISLEVFKDGK